MLNTILSWFVPAALGGIAAGLGWLGRFIFDFATDMRASISSLKKGQISHMRHSILAAYCAARDRGYVERPSLMLVAEIYDAYKNLPTDTGKPNNGWVDIVVNKLKSLPVKEDL